MMIEELDEDEQNYDERVRFVTINELEEVCEMGTFKDRFEKVSSLILTLALLWAVGSPENMVVTHRKGLSANADGRRISRNGREVVLQLWKKEDKKKNDIMMTMSNGGGF
ncbi:hypothetical protein L5515_007335 [Caenorhabditis briggsae]|uniref:Uncharacterized protein n=1 Tax=Caenorhabditis briggsae TaxID=6238 RepID=A0AAE9F1I0_CAEBR|nr:hypothetical protein L3Y34_007486 [Caenorhabditis briggsae]UMM34136.1 hypothetical protein L5515_007335 [Caenorhabditis briggsae]